MKASFNADIDALNAPPNDGEILIWPDAAALAPLAEENRRRLRAVAPQLLGRPADEWRDPTDAHADDDRLVIMTGHQPSFHHPGVWAKNVAACALAEQCGGRAHFLLVDSDVPHAIAIDWPDAAGPWRRLRRAAVPAVKSWRSYEQIRDRDEIDYAAMFNALPAKFTDGANPTMAAFIRGFLAPHASADAAPSGYVDRWINGISAADAELGLPPPIIRRISAEFDHRAGAGRALGLVFAAHLLLEAPRFAAAYNNALAAYRQRRGLKGTRHPIPDLAIEGESVESPFWMLHDSGIRQRLMLTFVGHDAIQLAAGTDAAFTLSRRDLARDPIATLAAHLDGWRIRPRALPQTMYARLFACDLFIHGIGGAKYDQITDAIIADFMGLEPPAYACVSATLRLPIPRHDVTQEEIRQAHQKARRQRHTPDAFVANAHGDTNAAPDADLPPAVAEAIEERRRAVADSDHLRAESPKARAARREAYARIAAANATLRAYIADQIKATHETIETAYRKQQHNRIADAREWFFALYPHPALTKLQATLRQPFSDKRRP